MLYRTNLYDDQTYYPVPYDLNSRDIYLCPEKQCFLKGGLNIANISTTNSGHLDNANALASYQIGIMGDLPLGKYVAIQPALLFNGKGSKTQFGNSTDNNYYRAKIK